MEAFSERERFEANSLPRELDLPLAILALQSMESEDGEA